MTLLFDRMAALIAASEAPERDGSATGEIGVAFAEPQQGKAVDSTLSASAVQSLPVAPPQPKGPDMPRGKKKDAAPVSGELPKPDFDHADSIYTNDIAPANREQKRAMKEASDGWKAVKAEARVNVAGARMAYKVVNMEEDEQQSFLRSFYGVLSKKGVGLYRDLVDAAEGGDEDVGDFVPPPTATPPAIDLPQLH